MPAIADIDLAALRHNLAVVRAVAPRSHVLAVVKANAYGHGLVPVVRALAAADGFAVAHLAEALALREAGIDAPVLLLEGIASASELESVARHRLMTVVHAEWQLRALADAAPAAPLDVWVKIDTGMHRIGFPADEIAAILQRLGGMRSVASVAAVMTHLACADDRTDVATGRQLSLFMSATADRNHTPSVANSGGILGWSASHGGWVRPGIMLYGASPFIGSCGADDGLRPVMTLKSSLIAVRVRARGDPIGYGASWQCPEDMPVGVVAAGYGDGYPRVIGVDAAVLVNGRRAPVIGRVSMDMICVDLRGQPDAKPGDPVVLWGEGLPVEEVARWAGTISYELLCRVSGRVPRHYV